MRPKPLAILAVAGLLLTGCTPDEQPREVEPTPKSSAPVVPINPKPGAAGAGDRYYPLDGNGGYDALAYDLKLTYNPRSDQLAGVSEMSARATQDLSRFNLDLRGLKVGQVRVDNRPAKFRHKGKELVITPGDALAKGSKFTVSVRYGGKPGGKTDPLIGRTGWMRSKSGGAYVLGEPQSASFWYPVNETPRDKAKFKITARVPKGWVAISIGRPGPITAKDGWRSYVWYDDNPVASFLTTLAVDRFRVDRTQLRDGTPVVSAYAPGATAKRSVEKRMPSVIRFLSRKFGPYPQDAAGGIYLADEIPFALETQGRPTYASWAEIPVVVHEYAHQWYGNSVSLRSWADICLAECIASYAQWLWEERADSADLNKRFRKAIGELRADSEFWSHKLYNMGPGHEFEGVYTKGTLAMHALRRHIGDKAFFGTLRGFAHQHRHGNASWPDLEQAFEKRVGKDLDKFLATWFRNKRIPAEKYLFPGSLGR